ncbi:nucleotidyltransferase domain-containing protein [Paenibacillus harenae]|uniref:nucleotidyltransferase domain-containing protein n=1 Tax=Paenibacillus harenae TaxID=306543 RepID=UPI002791295F|nr:nucleotidyltransferase family protein [Paenibacillus harenae]MDQ0063385.1 hypothetical protein [Paenibacillus harenae]
MSKPFTLDKEGLSTEMQLLLAFIRSGSAEEIGEIPERMFKEANWESFVDLSIHHRLHPYLYHKLKGISEALIPSRVIHILQTEYRVNTFQMLQLCGEMERLDKIFTGYNIRALYLKGPVLAKELYGDISLRTSCDLDLLVPIADLHKVEDLLITLGYSKDEYIHTILNDWKWRHHHYTFYHAEQNMKIEVHWRLNPAPSVEPGFEQLWERRRISSLSSHPIHYLGREDLFQFLVSHGARHGWSRLRWLLDIKQLTEQQLDGSKLKTILRKHHYSYIGGQALSLASELLGATIQADLHGLAANSRSQRLAQQAMFYLGQMINLHTVPVPRDVDRYHKRHMFALLTTRLKLQYVLSVLFPYPEDAETLPLPKSLHVLYFPLRPFLWGWRKMTAERK